MQKSFTKVCKTQIIILLYYSTAHKMKKENTFVESVTVIKPFFMEVTSKQSRVRYVTEVWTFSSVTFTHTHPKHDKEKPEKEKNNNT